MSTHFVIGNKGEVGSAIAEVLDCPGTDLGGKENPDSVEFLHIAIPYGNRFEDIVSGYKKMFEAEHVVVHSTVPVGTCDANGWIHSPVRGRHPNLAESLQVFPKTFGGESSPVAAGAWRQTIIDNGGFSVTHAVEKAADVEAAKLWELIQFGLQVRVTQAIYEWCEDNDLDPEVVYRLAAHDYNAGYQELGEDQFTRPVLDYVPGPIGGHCVTENSRLIDHQIAAIVEHGFQRTADRKYPIVA